jgi:TraM recognition site of TraD and TraG
MAAHVDSRPGLPTFDPTFLDEPGTTLYVLSPSDGTVAPLAVTLMEQLIRRQRVKVGLWEEYPRIGMFLDELPNTPLPKILQYFAGARGLGVSICAAAQASSQLDVVYGALQGRAIRDVVPATLIMYGAYEEELMPPKPPGSGPCTGETGTGNTTATNLSIPAPESKTCLTTSMTVPTPSSGITTS